MGLESLVASDSSLNLAGSVADLSQLSAEIQRAKPDIALVSLSSSLDEFLKVAAAESDAGFPVPLVVLGDEPIVARSPANFLHSGISALLPHDALANEILAALHAAAAGLAVIHPAMVAPEEAPESSIRPFRPIRGSTAGDAPRLTPREREILAMVADGLGNKEIAWRLKISEHTVKFHVNSIFTKLDASTRAEAVSLGFRLGLILV
jgi:two-component system, NarL family, response regulator YdfI